MKRVMSHVVIEIAFGETSHVGCDCGWATEAATPEHLAELFQRHRTKAGAPRRSPGQIMGAVDNEFTRLQTGVTA